MKSVMLAHALLPAMDFAAACAYAICAWRLFDTVATLSGKLQTMRPSLALSRHRDAVYQAAARFHVANPKVFGSALRGEDQDGSDLDLLVDALPETTLFDLGGLQDELQELLGVSVDVLTLNDLPPKFRDIVRLEAKPV